MTQDKLETWINQLIAENKLYKFYKCKEWRDLSDAVMKENNYECQYCKKRGMHTRARSVHHVQWIWKHPRLALSRTYVYKDKTYTNLVPLCENCHNKVHNKNAGLNKKIILVLRTRNAGNDPPPKKLNFKIRGGNGHRGF